MQVQSPQPLCRLSADIPLLERTPVDGSPQRQDVLQERCAVQSYRTHDSTALPQLGQRGCLSLPDNSYVQRSVTTGTYYTGNVHTQHIGLAGFGVERSEKQVKCELGRLYQLLERSEKYQTYREKQPALTPAEVVARDAAERKEQEKRKSQGLQQEKDKTVWPDFLERAFWTGKTALSPYRVSPSVVSLSISSRLCLPNDLQKHGFTIRGQRLTNIVQHSSDGRQWVGRNTCSKAHSEGEMN
jgi:transcriptional enhancer factor